MIGARVEGDEGGDAGSGQRRVASRPSSPEPPRTSSAPSSASRRPGAAGGRASGRTASSHAMRSVLGSRRSRFAAASPSASASSAAVRYRASRSARVARATMALTSSGSAGSSAGSSPASARIASCWLLTGLDPVSSRCSTHPSENTSARASTSLPRHCSGDMYAGVPLVRPWACARCARSRRRCRSRRASRRPTTTGGCCPA